MRNKLGILILVELHVSQYKAMLKHSTASYILKLHGVEAFLDTFPSNHCASSRKIYCSVTMSTDLQSSFCD